MPEFKMFGGTIERALMHAVTAYDRRQASKRHYNVYALPQYLQRVDEICRDIAKGAAVRAAICAAMTGPLLSACLKAVGEAPATRDELSGLGKYTYQPISER